MALTFSPDFAILEIMKKVVLLFLFLIALFAAPLLLGTKTVLADACSDKGNDAAYCAAYNSCITSGGTDASCKVQGCLADNPGGTTECNAASGAYAPGGWMAPTQQQYETGVADTNVNGDNFSTYQVNAFIGAGKLATLGCIGAPCAKAMTGNSSAVTYSGAVGVFADGIDILIKTKPASSIDYIAYLGNELHVPGTPTVAYAASSGVGGAGFTSLTPVLQIWTLVRNLSYMLFAIVFVVIGVMIMLRVKIDPKTAATIQGALPKVIFALILVTFSYAIAGFLVDLMYVLMGLLVTAISSMGPQATAQVNSLMSGSIFNFVLSGGLFGVAASAGGGIADSVNTLLGSIKGTFQGNAINIVIGGLAGLIVGVAILWALFKTWLALIGAYANFILNVILAPILLTLDAIPGQNQFENWMRNQLAYLLSFPLVVAMLAVGSAIATNFGASSNPSQTGFVPPLLGVGSQSAAQSFVGLGILLTIPKAVDMLQQMIKAPQNKFGSAWSEALGAGMRTTGAGASGGYQGMVGKATEQARLGEMGYQKAMSEALASGDQNRINAARRTRPGAFSRLAGRLYKSQ